MDALLRRSELARLVEEIGAGRARSDKWRANTFTGDVSVMCNDGRKHRGKTNEAACANYGGVKK